MRYLLWQFGHMHTLRFETANGSVYCPQCGDIYQPKEKKVSTPSPAPAPKPQRSLMVLAAFFFILTAVILVPVAATFSLPYLAALAVVDGLAAVTFAILSLRENAA